MDSYPCPEVPHMVVSALVTFEADSASNGINFYGPFVSLFNMISIEVLVSIAIPLLKANICVFRLPSELHCFRCILALRSTYGNVLCDPDLDPRSRDINHILSPSKLCYTKNKIKLLIYQYTRAVWAKMLKVTFSWPLTFVPINPKFNSDFLQIIRYKDITCKCWNPGTFLRWEKVEMLYNV